MYVLEHYCKGLYFQSNYSSENGVGLHTTGDPKKARWFDTFEAADKVREELWDAEEWDIIQG